nr:MAG TPA: hypothetical protein [Caudoviricetes sp.]
MESKIPTFEEVRAKYPSPATEMNSMQLWTLL